MIDLLVFQSHAKINLYLDILGRRPDGYHNIETIYQTVSLCDTLQVTESPRGLRLDCDDEEAGPPENNLALLAAELLRDDAGADRTATLEIHKEIPVASGLAGGSGDAAAALIALNQFWELGHDAPTLAGLGLELGSDVPFCLAGGTMGAHQRGEKLLPLPPMPETWFVLLHPEIQVHTASVYQHPDLGRSGEKTSNGWTTSFDIAVTAIAAGDVASALFNRMEEVVFNMHPELGKLKRRLVDAGCLGALMSGSGPTVFGVCDGPDTAERVSNQFPDMRRSVVHSVDAGVVQLD